MDPTHQTNGQLADLASHLSARRSAILKAWRDAVESDPKLTSASSLPRRQINDHIPHVLDAFERELRARGAAEHAAAKEESQEDAAAHGLHRWQQGYHLREVTREWGHLQLCLADELRNYACARANLDAAAMATAYRAVAEMCGEGVSDSTAQYFQLQQIEAEGNVRDLEDALEQVRELERQRAELWRQAAHDLRGNLGVVANVTAGLTMGEVPQPMRDTFLLLLKKNVSSLHSMLDDVISLARLQAGHEQRDVKPLDVAVLLRDLCESLQPAAKERGLFVKAHGPDTFAVDGDAVKIQRIAQNLLLNALKYTHQGGVTVRWGDSRKNDAERWMLSVEDTGPGFHAGPGAQLAGALGEATEEARQVEENPGEDDEQPGAGKPAPPHSSLPDPRPVHHEPGEGIGLSIVKRLSELLDATVEMTSEPGDGTIARIILPRHYSAVQQKP